MAYVSMDDFAAFLEALVAPLPPHLRAATTEIGRSFEDRPISLVQMGAVGNKVLFAQGGGVFGVLAVNRINHGISLHSIRTAAIDVQGMTRHIA